MEARRGVGGCYTGHRSSFETQINQGPLFSSFFLSVQGHPDYTRLKCVCVEVRVHAERPEREEWGREGGLTPVGLAYNSDRARELKPTQRNDGPSKMVPALRCI